jgi:PiT family inorganic phosphate transporter
MLISAGMAAPDVKTLPDWVVYSCYFAIAAGTYMSSWRIVGVGLAHRTRDVRWGVALNLIVAWVLTFPASGLIAAGFWWIRAQFL